MNVAPNYSFENDLTNIKTNTCVFGGWFPIGVVTEDGSSEIKIVGDVARTGGNSLRTTPNANRVKGTIYYSQYNGGEEVRGGIQRTGVSGARTIAFRMDQDIVSCDASVWIKKTEGQKISLKAIWYARRNRVPFIKIGEQQSNQPDIEKDGWYKYSLHADRKKSARQVQIAIVTDSGEPFHIDDVEIYFNRAAQVKILVDQLGYEPKSDTNRIILQSTTRLRHSPASFSLVKADNDKTVYTGKWKAIGYHREWDFHYWRGNFSDFNTPGRYVVKTVIDQNTYISPAFEIHHNLLVPGTAEPAYRFYYYQRCGTEVPGFHKACHLDDSTMPDGTYKDLAGGWHDAGDYNKYCGYTPESVYALVYAYEHRKDFFDQYDRDHNGRADILDEAEWGAKYLKKCINTNTKKMIATVSSGSGYWGMPDKETDNVPRTGDERPVRDINADASTCIPGLALLGKYLPEYLVLAERLYENQP
ncbi:MAG: glycoside hydrolase family 9 protein, partial [Planctomycetota bacterium]